MAEFLLPQAEALVEDKHFELWHCEFNKRHLNYLGPRDQVLITLARYPSLLLEAQRQKPILRWLDSKIKMQPVSQDKLITALVYLGEKGFITAEEYGNLSTIFNIGA